MRLQLLLLHPKSPQYVGCKPGWAHRGARPGQVQPSVAGQGQDPDIWGSEGHSHGWHSTLLPHRLQESACARALSPAECCVLEAGG